MILAATSSLSQRAPCGFLGRAYAGVSAREALMKSTENPSVSLDGLEGECQWSGCSAQAELRPKIAGEGWGHRDWRRGGGRGVPVELQGAVEVGDETASKGSGETEAPRGGADGARLRANVIIIAHCGSFDE